MKFNLTFLFLLFMIPAMPQVAVNSNGANPDGSAMLDVNSNNKGLLIPRLTSAERAAIQNPAAGLLVYDKDRLSIYMFDGGSWRPFAFASESNLQPVMRRPVGVGPNSNFGKSVALYGNYAVIGAPNDTVNGVATGAAYVFHLENGNWQQQAKIYASNGIVGDWFGQSVDIYKDLIVVGAPNKAISSDQARGRVYVFRLINNIWTSTVGLQAPDGKANDQFGSAVAVYENILVAGASGRDHSNFTNAGSVYPFALENNAWQSRGIINAWQNADNKYFGDHLDFWNYTLAVSSPGLEIGNVSCGGVFTYTTNATGTTWTNGPLIVPPSMQENIYFGLSLSIGNNYMVVSAPGYDGPAGSNTGYWFAFQRVNGAWQYYTGATHPASPGEEMGQSTAVDDESIFVTSPKWGGNKGRVILLDGYIKELHNPDPYQPTLFGRAVAAHSGNYIITSVNSHDIYFGRFY